MPSRKKFGLISGKIIGVEKIKQGDKITWLEAWIYIFIFHFFKLACFISKIGNYPINKNKYEQSEQQEICRL